MSFLICSRSLQVDQKKLATYLCPYVDAINSEHIGDQVIIYYNQWAEFKNSTLKLPYNHHYEPQAAWCNVSVGPEFIQIKTDPLGQCPIYYYISGQDYFITTEVKALKAILNFKVSFLSDVEILKIRKRKINESAYSNILKLPAGSDLILDYVHQEFKIKIAELPWHKNLEKFSSTAEATEELKKALLLSMNDVAHLPDLTVSSFLSGGIDSSVICALAAKKFHSFQTYSLGTEMGNEFSSSRSVSNFLKVRNHELILEKTDLAKHFNNVVCQNEITDGLTAEILLQLDYLSEVTSKNHENILTGYGADLLFGGMLRHKAYMMATGVDDNQSLIDRAIWSHELAPFYYWNHKQRLFHLYLHPLVIETALRIPLDMQFTLTNDKMILRNLAISEGWLDQEDALRSKVGMTNGTQINFLLSQVHKFENEHSYEKKSLLALEILKKEMIYA